MEDLKRMVSESFARHGIETAFDHRRLQWSQWFRCADSLSLLRVSSKPGLFALAEEVMTPGGVTAICGKRMLALFQVSEAEDLGMAISRLFLPRGPERERLAGGRCFARYAVIEDGDQRRAAFAAMQRWVASVSGVALGISEDMGFPAPIDLPEPIPSGF